MGCCGKGKKKTKSKSDVTKKKKKNLVHNVSSKITNLINSV
jgi:hypothetical protein